MIRFLQGALLPVRDPYKIRLLIEYVVHVDLFTYRLLTCIMTTTTTRKQNAAQAYLLTRRPPLHGVAVGSYRFPLRDNGQQ